MTEKRRDANLTERETREMRRQSEERLREIVESAKPKPSDVVPGNLISEK